MLRPRTAWSLGVGALERMSGIRLSGCERAAWFSVAPKGEGVRAYERVTRVCVPVSEAQA